jgi:cytochrome c-type biogenesis protein CcmE
MKKTHIIAIVIIAIALGVLVYTMNNSATYADFAEAQDKPNKEFHVVGKVDKAKAQIYNPTVNADEFTFYLIDNKGAEQKVVLHKSKPQDFDKSEQIVLIGKMHEGAFHANDILMKCPSKYNDQEVKTS